MLKADDSAPDFTRETVDGEQFRLGDVLQGGHHVLLVFLRHLG